MKTPDEVMNQWINTALSKLDDDTRDLVWALSVVIMQRDNLIVVLKAWLKAYDDTGPDNGPSLVEHDCALDARHLLETLKKAGL